MFRIGIMGTENSHAMAFSRIFNGVAPDPHGFSGYSEEICALYPDIKVVALGGYDEEASKKIAEACDVPFICREPEDMVDKVDAVMVTARDGAYHLPFAKPFLEAGKPAFIDKPFTNSVADAEALLDIAAKKGVPIVGGSSTKYCQDVVNMKDKVACGDLGTLRSASVTAPVSLENPYGGFYFYSAHLVEIAMKIFGYDPVSAVAVRGEGRVTGILRYKDFDVTCNYVDGTGLYAASAFGTRAVAQTMIDIGNCYALEAANYAAMLRTGKQDQSAAELLMPVRALNALKTSYETGKEQSV